MGSTRSSDNLKLDTSINSSKNAKAGECWFPTNNWRSRFMRRWNFSYKKNIAKTCYSKREYLSQIVSSLALTYALRTIFKIPSGQGRIINFDESMQYLYNPNTKSWV